MLADDIAAALPELRAHAQSRMTSTAMVYREGEPVTVDGLQVTGWDVLHAALPCWMDNAGVSSGTRTLTVGQTEVQVATRVWKIPHDTTGLRDGDVIAMTSGACAGRYFRLIEATVADQKKQQELPVIEIQKPEGL